MTVYRSSEFVASRCCAEQHTSSEGSSPARIHAYSRAADHSWWVPSSRSPALAVVTSIGVPSVRERGDSSRRPACTRADLARTSRGVSIGTDGIALARAHRRLQKPRAGGSAPTNMPALVARSVRAQGDIRGGRVRRAPDGRRRAKGVPALGDLLADAARRWSRVLSQAANRGKANSSSPRAPERRRWCW